MSQLKVDTITDEEGTGSPDFPNGITAGGLDVYAKGNILGTVSQSGGVPTGAVIQRGSNANGEFVRFADGTQICWHNLTIDQDGQFSGNSRLSGRWIFPVSFVDNNHKTSMTIPAHSSARFVGCNRLDVITFGVNAPSTVSTSVDASVFFQSGTVDTTEARIELIQFVAHGRWF